MKPEIINKIKVIRDRSQKERSERPSLQIPMPKPTDRDKRSKDAPSKENRIIVIDLM